MSGRLDQVLHPPARLQIAAVLIRVDEIDFVTLRDIVAVSDSVLSKHLSVLGEAGYVELRKAPVNGRQRTWALITGKGRRAFKAHVEALQELIASLERAVSSK